MAAQLGRGGESAASYTLVADAWRDADPELQPFVREARAALVAGRKNAADRSH